MEAVEEGNSRKQIDTLMMPLDLSRPVLSVYGK